ncbi:MAG: hypothetical protein Fur0025_05970 [Oscillatoriaceae cyanobacterium]
MDKSCTSPKLRHMEESIQHLNYSRAVFRNSPIGEGEETGRRGDAVRQRFTDRGDGESLVARTETKAGIFG